MASTLTDRGPTSPQRMAFCCGIGLALCLVLILPARADEPVYGVVDISPVRIDVVAAPGGPPKTFRLRLMNPNPSPVRIELKAEEFRLGSYGEILFEPQLRREGEEAREPFAFSGVKFLTFPEPSFELAPWSERIVLGRVRLPESARRQYYAMATAYVTYDESSLESEEADDDVSTALSVFVFIIAGEEGKDGTPIRYATPPRYALDVVDVRVGVEEGPFGPVVRVRGRFRNESNTHIFADAVATLWSMDGSREVERLDLSQGSRLVFPGTVRQLMGDFRSALEPGTYRLTLEVDGRRPELYDTVTTQFRLTQAVRGLDATMFGSDTLALETAGWTTALEPGGAAQETITVMNRRDRPIRVVTAVAEGETQEDVVHLRVTPARFTLPPKGHRALRLTASADWKAAPKMYRRRVLLWAFETDGSPLSDEEPVQIEAALYVEPRVKRGVLGRRVLLDEIERAAR